MGIHEEKRGTGRTHNMLMEALHIGSGKVGTAVVMLNQRDIEHTVHQILPSCFPADHHYWSVAKAGNQYRVLVGGKQTIVFLTAERVGREYNNHPERPHEWQVPGLETFVDHAVIENYFHQILRAWTRYDNELHRVNFRG